MGGGKKNLACESVFGQEYCIVAKNVVETYQGYSICFQLENRLLAGSVIVSHDLGCYQVSCGTSSQPMSLITLHFTYGNWESLFYFII